MRTLRRNMRPFYYAMFDRKEERKDENGYPSGTYESFYFDPVLTYGNVSASIGQVDENPFGALPNYDRVIVIDNPNIEIDEHTILWIERTPDAPHDYIVESVARSVNSVAIAIKQVNVTS